MVNGWVAEAGNRVGARAVSGRRRDSAMDDCNRRGARLGLYDFRSVGGRPALNLSDVASADLFAD